MSKKDEMKKLVKEAIQEFKKENQLQQKKQVYHNTRLLLRNYKELMEHVLGGIDNLGQIDCNMDMTGLDEDELYILSIKRSRAKTLIMLAHVDVSLEKLQAKQAELGTPEKYKALEMYYFEGKTYEEIQEGLHCGTGTSRRWINQMVNQLSVYLFGIEGLSAMQNQC